MESQRRQNGPRAHALSHYSQPFLVCNLDIEHTSQAETKGDNGFYKCQDLTHSVNIYRAVVLSIPVGKNQWDGFLKQ